MALIDVPARFLGFVRRRTLDVRSAGTRPVVERGRVPTAGGCPSHLAGSRRPPKSRSCRGPLDLIRRRQLLPSAAQIRKMEQTVTGRW
jgi:hypothetical protein